METYRRLFWAQRVISIALLVGISMSFSLWLNDRTFPMIPILPYTLPLNSLSAKILLGLLGFGILSVLVFVKTRIFVLLVVLLMLLVAFQDFNRLQPWFFQYWTFFVILIPLARSYKKYLEVEHLLFALQIALVSVYFFSGLFKFNDGFYQRIVPYVFSPITEILIHSKPWLYPTAFAIPWIEIALAIGLFIPKIRIFAIIGGTLLHIGILVLIGIGPLGKVENSIILPWNVALIFLLWILFFKAKNFNFQIYIAKLQWPALVIMVMVVLLPFLNLKGWYNEHLSYELYSGRTFNPYLRYHYKLIKNTPEYLAPYTWKTGDTVYVDSYKWSMEECNTPPNSDIKVILKVQEKVLKEFQ